MFPSMTSRPLALAEGDKQCGGRQRHDHRLGHSLEAHTQRDALGRPFNINRAVTAGLGL